MSSLSLSLALPSPRTPRAAAFGQIVRNEARLVRRQPTNMIGSIGLPVVLMIIFGELPSFHQPSAALGGLTGFDTYVPVIMVLGLTMLTLLGLPGPLVSYRELGVLRRLSTTPVPPSWLLAAQVVVQLGIALAGLLFFAGLWLPRAIMPAILLDISNYTPLGAAVEAIQDSIRTGFPPVAPLLVLDGYTLVFAFLARRFFRWD
jgi:ABC-2 type transport system permease protein